MSGDAPNRLDAHLRPWTPEERTPLHDSWGMEEPGPELREYWGILVRRRAIVAAFFVAVVGSVLLFSLLSTPIYSAETVLLIEPTDPEVLDIKQVVGSAYAWDEDYYRTQHEILRSRSLAARVVHELGLEEEPAFVGGESDSVAAMLALGYSALSYWISSWFSEEVGLSQEDVDSWLVDLYLHGLWVEPVRSSRLVRLYFNSPDPELAARTVNAHAAAYIEQGLEFRNRASQKARAFLEGKLAELRARVEESEAALHAYRREHGIVSLDDKSNVVIERLADLNEHLTRAEAERIALEADATLIRSRQAESLPAVIESPLVRTLKQQLVELEGEHASMARRFKPGYPRRAELESQIREIRARLAGEIRSIVQGIESAFLAAQTREAELRARMQAQKEEALRLKDASVEYAILAHDAETSRRLYDGVRQRIQETAMAAELPASNVFVIDAAHPPLLPAWPRTQRNLAFGLLLGLMGGVGLAFLAEYLDGRPRGADEVERLLRIPSLGAVPELPQVEPGQPSGRRRLVARAAGLPARAADGRFDVPQGIAEAYRSIRTNLLLCRDGEPPHTLLFTSAGEGEGKTTTVLHTATMFAQLGAPVLVIDAHLRRPSCHRLLGVDNRGGLAEVLAGRGTRMQRVQVLGAQLGFLASGATPPNPTELLGSERMRKLLELLGKRFQYILIDAPPLGGVSDAVVLSTLVDGVVLVIDRKTSPRQALQQARSRLAYARARVLGFVLNRSEASAPERSELEREVA